MKTSAKLSFPKLENDFLENILRQLVNQYTIVQLFFTKEPAPLYPVRAELHSVPIPINRKTIYLARAHKF
jgi:hypothetical protein